MNARYLAHEGYGMYADDLEDPNTIPRFLEALPRYQEKLATYSQAGNKDLLDALDHQLDRAAAGLF